MKIDVYVLCYNEMDLAPFAVQYWQRYADRVFVYDNGSDDGTIEYLSQFPFITIRHYDSDNKINDAIYLDIKNNVWKESRGNADFVVVGDFDEFIYSNDLHSELEKMKSEGYTLCKPVWYNMVCDTFPEYNPDVLFHKIVTRGHSDSGKTLIFDPNKIREIDYLPGAHMCKPKGEVKHYKTNSIFTFHANPLNLDWYTIKMHKRGARMSELNRQKWWGSEYLLDNKGILKRYNIEADNAKEIKI